MIVFHEGLPGSGKSYEACIQHIIPALMAGRRVVTNIEGINHAKFAEVTGIPEKICKMLLLCVFHPEEDKNIETRIQLQKQSILDHSGKDALIVIDEIQNLFPSGREKLSEQWQRYITEHRHDGLDIILMGQDRRDCHNIWRRRIQRVITFTKQTALGRDQNYTWVAYEATTPEKYRKIRAGGGKYEKKYFGLYDSHTGGTENTSSYSDDRINIFKSGTFRFGIPAFLVVLGFAIWNLVGFMSVDEPEKPKPSTVQQTPKRATVQYGKKPAEPPVAPQPVEPEKEPEYVPVDVFDELANKNRPRLSGIAFAGDKMIAQVDILSSTFHLQDSFTLKALSDLGWSYEYRDAGLLLKKEGRSYLVRSWPLDRPGRVNNEQRLTLRQ